jgi:hypothetical protein
MNNYLILTTKGEKYFGDYKLNKGLIEIYHYLAFRWVCEKKRIYLLNLFPYNYYQRFWKEIKNPTNPIIIPVNNIELIVKLNNNRRLKNE